MTSVQPQVTDDAIEFSRCLMAVSDSVWDLLLEACRSLSISGHVYIAKFL